MNNKIKWKPIKGFEEEYKISNLGEVEDMKKNRKLKQYRITVKGEEQDIVILVKSKQVYLDTVDNLVNETFDKKDILYKKPKERDEIKKQEEIQKQLEEEAKQEEQTIVIEPKETKKTVNKAKVEKSTKAVKSEKGKKLESKKSTKSKKTIPPTAVIDLNTGITYKSMTACAKALGVSKSTVYGSVYGTVKNSILNVKAVDKNTKKRTMKEINEMLGR